MLYLNILTENSLIKLLHVFIQINDYLDDNEE